MICSCAAQMAGRQDRQTDAAGLYRKKCAELDPTFAIAMHEYRQLHSQSLYRRLEGPSRKPIGRRPELADEAFAARREAPKC